MKRCIAALLWRVLQLLGDERTHPPNDPHEDVEIPLTAEQAQAKAAAIQRRFLNLIDAEVEVLRMGRQR